MTRTEVISAVKNYLNRPAMPDEDVGLLIATLEGELNRELREHPRSEKRASLAMPDTTGILPLPDDIAQLLRVYDAGGNYPRWPIDLPPGNNRGFLDRGSVLELIPHPAVSQTIYMDYHAYLNPLEGPEDRNWVSNYHSDIYLYGCLKEAAVFLKDDPRLAGWQVEFTRRLESLQLQGWNQNLGVAPKVRTAR